MSEEAPKYGVTAICESANASGSQIGGGHFLTLPMEITKTDLLKTIAYLDDAAKIYDAMSKPRHRWRAVLIRRLNIKLKKLLENGKD